MTTAFPLAAWLCLSPCFSPCPQQRAVFRPSRSSVSPKEGCAVTVPFLRAVNRVPCCDRVSNRAPCCPRVSNRVPCCDRVSDRVPCCDRVSNRVPCCVSAEGAGGGAEAGCPAAGPGAGPLLSVRRRHHRPCAVRVQRERVLLAGLRQGTPRRRLLCCRLHGPDGVTAPAAGDRRVAGS